MYYKLVIVTKGVQVQIWKLDRINNKIYKFNMWEMRREWDFSSKWQKLFQLAIFYKYLILKVIFIKEITEFSKYEYDKLIEFRIKQTKNKNGRYI